MKRIPFPAATTAVLATVILLAACGSDAPAADDTPLVTAAVTTQASAPPAASTTSTSPPVSRIVSLSPTATEMLYAIGAGAQVLAVDDQSNYPPEVLDKPHELSGYQPNVEAIAALKPDLVLIGDDTSGLSKQLDSLGLATWVGLATTSFDGMYDQIEQLGALTGHVGDAAELVSKVQTDIHGAVKAAPKPAQPLTYYHELDNTYYSVTENTFIGQVYSLFGMHSIADLQEVSSDYPQLSAESIISANPDFIFLADGGFGESPETVAARPGWANLEAVTNGNVVVVDADISSRWGPRIVDYIKAISAAVSKAVAAG
ncbi:MAG TPA: ABC transporter substrate-binding protein [Ilumatobacteraceae bacterium]|nr:ABC transporter substrate-binding protein [Ilumatobacteraceae bacterium]